MSTKICAGFRFRSGSWRQAHEHVMAFRDELAGVVQADRCKAVAVRACEIVDRRTLGLAVKAERSPIAEASREQFDDERNDPRSFDLALFPRGGRIYGIAYGNNQHEALLLDKPFVEPWGYWNNSDRPEDVTAREWNLRRRTWDAILGDRVPAMAGFTAKCIPKYLPFVLDRDVMAHLPSLEERAKRISTDAAWTTRGNEDPELRPAAGVREFFAWLSSPDGIHWLKLESERVLPLLEPTITLDMLTAPIA